jgi:hypothetical protein
MPVPLHTTTVSVRRVAADPTRDPYDAPPAPAVVASSIRAHISSPRGREQTAGGSQEVVEFRLTCDPVDLRHTDQVQDEQTSALYEVTWARTREGLGIDQMQAGLRQVTGVVA